MPYPHEQAFPCIPHTNKIDATLARDPRCDAGRGGTTQYKYIHCSTNIVRSRHKERIAMTILDSHMFLSPCDVMGHVLADKLYKCAQQPRVYVCMYVRTYNTYGIYVYTVHTNWTILRAHLFTHLTVQITNKSPSLPQNDPSLVVGYRMSWPVVSSDLLSSPISIPQRLGLLLG